MNHHATSVDHVKINSWYKFGECITPKYCKMDLKLDLYDKKQPTNKLKIKILSETSILYLIRHAPVILTVGLHLRMCQQANIAGRKIVVHSGL